MVKHFHNTRESFALKVVQLAKARLCQFQIIQEKRAMVSCHKIYLDFLTFESGLFMT